MKKLISSTIMFFAFLFTEAQCQADFSYIQNGPTIIFTDLSIINPGWSTNYSVTYQWDFGDGSISTQQNPVHTYANNGIYVPCLTVIFFDSVIINTCVSYYCDSILIGNSVPSSWDCNPTNGCYDPGNGLGQYSSLAACQTGCVSVSSNLCDSMTLISSGGSPQTILIAEVPNINTIIDYWITTANDGTVLGEDSLWNSHNIFNNMNNGQPYDTINVCITYTGIGGLTTCCVSWIWNSNTGFWAKMGTITKIEENIFSEKKLVKIVNMLVTGKILQNNLLQILMYDDGTVEKRIIIE